MQTEEQKRRLKRRLKSKETNSNSWKGQCRILLHEIIRHDDSEPFRHPVDTLRYDDYLKFIDTPMDLNTIREQLVTEAYESPNEFYKDMQLIFRNSRAYNDERGSKILKMTDRLSAFFEAHIRSILTSYKTAIKNEKRLKRERRKNKRAKRNR